MAKPKIELNESERELFAEIPSASEAAKIWKRFENRRIEAKADREALGTELVAVRKALGNRKGGDGLFSRWLRCNLQMSYVRAYSYMALVPGGGKPKTKRKSYTRAVAINQFFKRLRVAESNKDKRVILRELITWTKREYDIR